jgi:Protein of unknown function
MLDAAGAIDRAGEVIRSLDDEDRAMLNVPLRTIIGALHFELLDAVYLRFPDLRPPPAEEHVLDTVLEWQDITLPESVSEIQLDQILFSVMNSQWRKTALVISRALERCQQLALPVGDELLSARIQALAEANRLDSKGDLRRWRFSEVRLKG